MMLNDGEYKGQRLLKKSTVELMTTNQIDTLLVGKNKFGLGFEITTSAGHEENGTSVGSFAWGGYFSTQYWADPKLNLVGELFLQQSPLQNGQAAGEFKKKVYQSLNK